MATADPPRQPTPADRRRIQEALDQHYAVDVGRYRANFSDKALGAQLKVPPAWIAEERERAFGPDGNEAQADAAAKLQAIEERAAALEAQGMELAAAAETLRGDAQALRAAIRQAA